MTIESIEAAKNCGVFDFSKADGHTSPFAKYNLIYGWNGSGKSTLSRLFYAIESGEVPPSLSGASFAFKTVGGSIHSGSLGHGTPNVRVFNEDFVERNIEWSGSARAILLVSEEKIEEKAKLEKLKKEIERLNGDHFIACKKVEECKKSISAFYSDAAKQLKAKFQILDAKDAYYLNYNKTKLEAFLDSNSGALDKADSILGDEEVASLLKAARPDYKDPIRWDLVELEPATLGLAVERLSSLLETCVASAAIHRLRDNPDIQLWVERGLKLRELHPAETCEFCGAIVTEERLKELSDHFNDHFRQFKDKLIAAQDWLKSKRIPNLELPPSERFYEELRERYTKAVVELEKAWKSYNRIIEGWIEAVAAKSDNPFEASPSVAPVPPEIPSAFNCALGTIKSVIDAHNKKTAGFSQEIAKIKKRLELHYAAEAVADFNLPKRRKELANLEKALAEIEYIRKEKCTERDRLEAILANETLGAEAFNRQLHQFLGRKDIYLKFSKESGGYRILRGTERGAARNLSEGEKTAIAFIYFITKLSEGGNKVEDTVVVVDDPVSSFDSNNLFQSYSFLRSACGSAKQLFVLTHNFTFYRLVRDWMLRKNKKDKIRARVYVVEPVSYDPRRSAIRDAEDSLTLYSSEYHYLFSRLYGYLGAERLSHEEAFLVGNIARKLLEAFLSFKFPKKRNDFMQLMEAAVKDDIKRERVYRFVNRYSHNLEIEVEGAVADSVFGESAEVVRQVLEVFDEVDPVHFQEMVSLVPDGAEWQQAGTSSASTVVASPETA